MSATDESHRKNLLMVHDYPPTEGGGVELNVFKTGLALREFGYKVKIATSRFASETYVTPKTPGMCSGLDLVLIEKVEQLESLILEADIVHIHFTFSFRPACMTALKLCVRHKKRCVFSIRTSIEHSIFSSTNSNVPLESESKIAELKSLLNSKYVTISAPSEFINNSLQKIGVNKRLIVIRNGVETLLRIPNNHISPVDITYVGELSFLKGVNYLLDAVKELKNNFPNLKVRLIGDGESAEQIKKFVSFFNLDSNVEFTGYINNREIASYLLKTKIYVHPSLSESWGNAVIEALSLKVPTVCTNAGGLTEVTHQGKFAAIVPMANTTALVRVIKKSLSHKGYEILKAKATNASLFIKQNLTYQKQATKLDALYKSL